MAAQTPIPTPNPATVTRPRRSSRRVSRKSPLGWLPWALLALLALLLALALLLINAVDDDGPDGPAGDSLGQINSGGSGINGKDGDSRPAGAEGSTRTQPNTGGTTGPGGAGTTGTAAANAELSAGGRDILAAAGGSLAGLINQPANGTARVQDVVSDEGFWVGGSTQNRVFVFLTPQARRSSGESGFQVKAGQTVRLTGQVVRPTTALTAGVSDREGREQVNRQNALIAADSVQLAS